MKRILLVFLLLVGLPVLAQTTSHGYTLNWTAGSDDTGFKVYQASGTCPINLTIPLPSTFTLLSTITSATTTTYTATGIAIGTYCIAVTGTASGAESNPATVNPSVPPFPVTHLTITIQ